MLLHIPQQRTQSNMAGFMVDNISKGRLKQWHLEEAALLPRDSSAVLLDTRTAEEFARGHIEGFCNIPVDELRERLDEIERTRPLRNLAKAVCEAI